MKNAALNFEFNSEENNYETVVSLDNQIQVQNQNLVINLNQNLNHNNFYDNSYIGEPNHMYYSNQKTTNTTNFVEETNKQISIPKTEEISKK